MTNKRYIGGIIRLPFEARGGMGALPQTDFEGLAVLALQLQFSPEMSFARIGLMGSAPRRPCEDIGLWDAPLGKLRGDTADFLDRPADQERRFGRDRSFVFLSDRPVLAR